MPENGGRPSSHWMNCSRSAWSRACCAGLKSWWSDALECCSEDSVWLSVNSSPAVHSGIHNGKAHTHLARVLSVIPRPRVSPPETFIARINTWFLCISLEFIHVHDIMQAAHLLVVQMCWFCIMKVARCMEEWQHLSNGVQMQGSVTCLLRPDEISNQCDGGEILYPKLGCLIQGNNFTKHVFHMLIQRNHGWVLHSISYTVLPMQDILIELAELCNFSHIQDIRGLEENGC